MKGWVTKTALIRMPSTAKQKKLETNDREQREQIKVTSKSAWNCIIHSLLGVCVSEVLIFKKQQAILLGLAFLLCSSQQVGSRTFHLLLQAKTKEEGLSQSEEIRYVTRASRRGFLRLVSRRRHWSKDLSPNTLSGRWPQETSIRMLKRKRRKSYRYNEQAVPVGDWNSAEWDALL